MKIGEIEVGQEYGVLAKPSRGGGWGKLPRKVRVEEVVTVPEEYWTGGTWSVRRETRNVRKLRVTFLDDAQAEPNDRWSDLIERAVKGTSADIAPKHFIAPWANLRVEVHQRIEAEQLKKETQAAYEARLLALLGKKSMDDVYSYFDVTVYRRERELRVTLQLTDKELERVLSLAEKGAACEDA